MSIDLRSDTVTQPTPAMREAIARAQVGDDVYGEDPTVAELERRTAALLGKPRGLFVSSGTMGNQLAILCHTSRGDEVYAGQGAHCVWYESGAAAALGGVQVVEVGRGGLFDEDELAAAIKPRAYYGPIPRLVVLENTHNRGGGKVVPADQTSRIARLARREGLALHLDGARLWNASVASGLEVATLAAPFDSATVCFSKGLGAPVGSVLVGSDELVTRAHRLRKMLGGGMRQAGILAAAALHALDHHVDRLADDHAAARAFAEHLRASPLASRGRVAVGLPDTNIVMVDLDIAAEPVVRALADRGVRLSAFGPKRLRAVTHLDVPLDACVEAARAVLEVVGSIEPSEASKP